MVSLKQNTWFSYGSALLLSIFLNLSVAGETTRVSLNSRGQQGNSNSNDPTISADGRYVAFYSSSSNLVPKDTNNSDDVFVYDRLTKQTTRVSINNNGEQGNGASFLAEISGDGRFVVFGSVASNLVPLDSNNKEDVFVHDRLKRQTIRVSVDNNGFQGNSSSGSASISSDGRFVVFQSDATNLVKGGTKQVPNVFIHDVLTRQTTLININKYGKEGNYGSQVPSKHSISADGHFVAFVSFADDLVFGDTNGAPDVFLFDRVTQSPIRISVDSNGIEGNGPSYQASLSVDGRYIAFTSQASNLILNDNNNDIPDIFIHDRISKQTSRVSIGSKGEEGNMTSFDPSISADGRFVAFESFANNLIAGDTNSDNDVFIRDRLLKQTTRVSISDEVIESKGNSNQARISADGRFVTFSSSANNLVIDDTNISEDVFVRDRFLDENHLADLKINVVQQPWSLAKNSYGAFNFKITNNGPDPVNNVFVTHLVSNGPKLLGILASQGGCTRYATISLCQLGKLLPGNSLSLFSVAKSDVRNPLIQRVTVSGQPIELTPGNNRVYVSTKVRP
jgi:hypothetical protein